ncbi:MAG: hypothetical protein ACM3UP_01125 [Methanocella sp.]
MGAFLAGFVAVRGGAWSGAPASVRPGAINSLAADASGGLRAAADARRSSFVVVTDVLPYHPSWGELTALAAEVDRESSGRILEQANAAAIARKAKGEGKAAGATAAALDQQRKDGIGDVRSSLEAVYARRWEAEQARLAAEAERKVAERRAVLGAQVDEQVGVKRGELKAALTEQVDRIRREREARLLSLQLQLGLKDKDPSAAAQAAALQEQVSRVQAEIDKEIKAAQQESADQLAAFASEAEAAATRTLKAFAAEVETETGRQGEAVRQALERELSTRLAELDSRAEKSVPGGAGAAEAPAASRSAAAGVQTPTPLQLRRNALQAAILADVKRLSSLVASRRGLSAPQIVASPADRPQVGEDLTAEVARLLTN